MVFPDYFYGQIYEARHQPGTFALPARVVWDLLDATCDEIGRNGFRKIVLVNGHGGNPNLLRYFAQTQLERPAELRRLLLRPGVRTRRSTEGGAPSTKSNPAGDMHAGERETSTLLYLRPGPDGAGSRDAGVRRADQKRWAIPDVYTAIWWFARLPQPLRRGGTRPRASWASSSPSIGSSPSPGPCARSRRTTRPWSSSAEFFDRVGQ